MMKQNNCKNCGTEISSNKQKNCVNCGAKLPQPIYKKWWFWLIVVLGGIIIIAASGGEDDTTSNAPTEIVTIDISNNGTSNPSNNQNSSQTKTYESVDLQQMINELEQNAMKAESTYQNKYVQVVGKIDGFDSDGAYITIEPVGADEWNFDTVMCYIKNDTQRQFLMNKSKGDTVTVKGKITTIGEFIGYCMDIDEIS
jgi:hypothetical protein